MNLLQKKVEEFHKAFKCPAPSKPTLDIFQTEKENQDHDRLRVALLEEEVEELKQALHQRDIVDVADAVCDILYLAFGTAVSYGLDIEPFFLEVCRSNMSKLPADGIPLLRQDGKILKPETYTRPDLVPLLLDQLHPNKPRIVEDEI